MKTISLKVPDELDSRLTAAARRSGKRRSAIARESLSAYLDAAGGSCLELVADLAGCAKGPRDLSRNAKYLRGYGR
jgi:predicted transcriptional regulator